MINVKDAVKISLQYAKEVFGEAALRDLALEEVELSEDERYWEVTVGFTRHLSEEPGPRNPFEELVGGPKRFSTRVYKVIRINAETGEPVAIKIRKI